MSEAIGQLIASLERLGEPIVILGRGDAGAELRIVSVNAEFTHLFGYADEAVGQSAELLWGALTDRAGMAWLFAQLEKREVARSSAVLYGKSGEPHWTEIVASPVEHESEALHHVVLVRDVTSRKMFVDALAAEKQKLETTLAAIAEAVATILSDGRVEFVNEVAEELLGISLVDAYGVQVNEVFELLDGEGNPIDLRTSADGDPVRRGHGHLRTAARATVDVAYVASRIEGGHGTVVVMRDVTMENRLALRLTFEASHDPLTGLPNRRAFLERLEDVVRGARERGEHHAVAFLDLDRFKVVNDRFGHAVGDRLLREVARVMGRAVRGGDVIARIGGDEFALLLTNCRLDDARRVAEKLRAAVDEYRIEHQGETLQIGVSVGLAPVEADAGGPEAVIAEADAACYQAKAAGRNSVFG